MAGMMQPQIILLKEGTDDSQGIGQLVSNITACTSVVDIVATTLGPRGQDKLIMDAGKKVTISNDGATILKLLDVVHPAAKTMVDIAQSQDEEVGDGTTSVVVLAGEFLRNARPYVEEGVHPQVVIRAFRRAANLCVKRIREIATAVSESDPVKKRDLLIQCAKTAMNSKLIKGQRDFFGEMVVSAVECLDDDIKLECIGMKQVTGGSLQDSKLIRGVAFKKTFSYAGFEQQPKHLENPKIVLLNVELELKAEKDNAEIRIDDIEEYERVVDAEYKIIFDKLKAIADTGAKVVLSKLPIGDLATQYFADRQIFCAGRVDKGDLARVAMATGGAIQTSTSDLSDSVIGTCGLFEEVQFGAERYNVFTGCPGTKTATIVIRGGAEQFIEEAERSLHDAIMIVRRAIKAPAVVGGGGAIEMELSRFLREHARTIRGKEQLLINSFAKALEVIPRQLAINAGFDSTDLLNKLRQKHAQAGGTWFGVDINNDSIIDQMTNFVWEPTMVKINAITAATEATCMILSIDETIKNPTSEINSDPLPGGPGSRGGRGGRGGRRMR